MSSKQPPPLSLGSGSRVPCSRVGGGPPALGGAAEELVQLSGGEEDGSYTTEPWSKANSPSSHGGWAPLPGRLLASRHLTGQSGPAWALGKPRSLSRTKRLPVLPQEARREGWAPALQALQAQAEAWSR